MSGAFRNGLSGAVAGMNEGLDPSRNNHLTKMSETNEHSSVLTLKQAAEYLRISKAHLSNVINGRVPDVPTLSCARIGRRILIKREWADEWQEKAGQRSPLGKW